MPSTAQLLAFVAASVVFILLPGPSLLFSIGRALSVGRAGALLSAWGNAIGLLAQVAAVAIGLGALVAASATAYSVLKLVGAAYVIYLGVQAIRHRADARLALGAAGEAGRRTGWRDVGAGVVVGATNPKTIVFFAAFLPQFTDPDTAATPQLLLLGVLFAALAACLDSVWVLAAGQARAWFAREPHRLDRVGATGGVAMIGLGAGLAVEGAARS